MGKVKHEYAPFTRKLLEDPGLMPEQREDIEIFLEEKEADGTGEGICYSYALYLTKFGKFIKKPFKEASYRDIVRFIRQLREDKSKATVERFKGYLKTFERWLYEDEPAPPKWLRKLRMNSTLRDISPSDLLTEDEIMRIIDVCPKRKYKALFALLAETGSEISGILGLRIRDVELHDRYAIVNIRGKRRGAIYVRSIPVKWARKWLKRWLRKHPNIDDPNAPLFPSPYGGPLGQDAVRLYLKRMIAKAGIEKRVYPHLFRHTRLTELSKHVTERILEGAAGWVRGSQMPKRYVHLSGAEVTEALLKLYRSRKL